MANDITRFGTSGKLGSNLAGMVGKAKWLVGISALAASTTAMAAPPLVLNNVGLPTQVGSGQGKRAIWVNGGSVGGQAVDIVVIATKATFNHSFESWDGVNNFTFGQPTIASGGTDNVDLEWRIYRAGTYNITNNTGGVLVPADVHVQFNDVDGPNNERVFTPICAGDVKWVRIDADATTGRAFGTVNAQPDIFSLIGDKSYNSQPESGLEIFYPNVSIFKMGRTGNSPFRLRLGNPTYLASETLDYECADFKAPVAVNDSKEGVPGSPTVIDILANDSTATQNNNGPNNNTLAASEFGRSTVSLVGPSGVTVTNIITDAKGDVIGFTVPGEGKWAYSDTTGQLTFTPDPSFTGNAAKITYTVDNALGVASNAATVTVWYPGIGVTKSSTFKDENGDGFGQVGETIDYLYNVKAYGIEPLNSVTITETGFTGAGTAPVPIYQSGDTNTDVKLDLTETWVFKASYALVAADLTSGTVTNSAIASGQTAAGTVVTDTSDSSNPADGNGTGTPLPGPNNGDPTKTTLPKKPISADNDSQSGTILANVGASNAYNVLDGDLLNTIAATVSNVTLSIVNPASNPGVSFDIVTGLVSVAAGTPAGNYTIDYTICEIGNPTNCAAAQASIIVTAPSLILAANDAVSGVNGTTGNPNALNAFTNDRLNNALPAAGAITATVTTPATPQTLGAPVPTLDVATGAVSIPANTPVGNYTIAYKICEVSNPTNCAPATITVEVVAAPIVAAADSKTGINGAVGDPAALNVLTGDTINGVTATTSNVIISVAPGSSVPPQLSFDPTTGVVGVKAGTPAGAYSFNYQICDALNPANCKSAAASVTVDPSPIVATNDSVTGINGANGANNILNLFAGDLVNNQPAAPSNSAVSVAPSSSLPSGITLDSATGNVSVAPGTPAGTYSFVYQLCELLNPANCKTATASVTVAASPIVATSNSATGINGAAGAPNVVNAFGGDLVNGVTASPTNAILSVAPTSSVPAGLSFDPSTGNVSVAPGTPAGPYTFDYQLCERLNPSNCSTATISVDVVAAPISAAPDSANNVNGATGAPDVLNLFGGDLINGAAAAPANSTLRVNANSTIPAGLSLNSATGNVSVAPGTPAGTYSFQYDVCETLNPANCATATATVAVVASPLSASDNNVAGVNGASGAPDVVNAFIGDVVNGVAATPANSILSVAPGSSVPARLTFDTATGNVSVTPGTAAGTYSFEYQLCERLNPSNCSTAMIKVDVVAALITTTTDAPAPVNGATGGSDIINVLNNDRLNGLPVTLATVTLAVTNPASNSGVVLDPATGLVSVAPGTPAGSYTIAYEICERLNPSNCSTNTVTVVVEAAPILAANDTAIGVNGTNGAVNVVNAFAADTLNGQPATPANTTAALAPGASVPAGLTFDPSTGNVSVAPGTPAGTYAFNYQLCERLNPTNCSIATISVTVDAAPIAAENDSIGPVNGLNGAPNLINALTNDVLNGQPVTIGSVNLTVTNPASNPGVVLDPATGLVSVAPGTPAGTYSIGYQICEKLNPANCATATIAVVVGAAPILAASDAPLPVNGANGGNDIINAYANDMLNGQPVNPSAITGTVTSPATPSVTGALVPLLDPATGLVDVPAGTPAGTYTIGYQICETLNPANCALSTITIVVEAPAIVAANDTPAPVRQGIGNPAAINAFANDMLNGAPVDPALIMATILTPAANPGVALDPATGNVSVAADVPAGTYTITYQICEKRNPANCKTASVTVTVEPPVAAVEGTVFTDLDGDGQIDPDEPRRAGWIVEIVRDGVVVATRITDANGNYRAEGLLSGPGYEIRFRNSENNVVYDIIKGVTLGNNTTVIDQNQPIDPSGVFYDSITRRPISGVRVSLTDANGVPLPAICFADASQAAQTTGISGEYRFDIVPGAAPQCPVGETIYRIAAIPPAGYAPGSTVLLPQPGPFDPTGLPAPVRINPAPTAPTSNATPFYLDFRLAAGDPDIINNHIALDPFLNRTPLIVTKTSIKRSASSGDLVPYEITVRNTEAAQRSGVTVVDILPPGMKYILGTASVNGAPLEPVRTDRQLSWTGQVIPGNGSVRYNLTLIVGAGVTGGEKINTGLAQNGADNSAISNRGTAVISITPNAVFDCSELLGKVFEDANRNGYQDENEPGVPGVRLATVNGQLITTDAFGRYHIACAAVPDARIGSNFVLKLDARTLPLGWGVTTDNPRSIRLTRGKFGELNFGVAPQDEDTIPPAETSANVQEKGE